jgi:hypothetical protein
MKLIKLRETNSRDYVYVLVQNITALRVEHSVTTYDGNTITATVIDTSGSTYTVRESMAEVVALIEGRDPNPARVLFGDKSVQEN